MTQLIDLGKLRFHFAGQYDAATTYEINDIVKYGGNVYVYSNPVRTAGNLPTNNAYWALMVEGFKFQGEYDAATQYRIGDGVAHGGVVYIAILDSTGQTPPNNTYWSQMVDGIQWEGEYNALTSYQKNDIVKFGGRAYIAVQDSTGQQISDPVYWETMVDGISPEGVYNAGTTYQPGDVVGYGPNLYVCTTVTTGNIPEDTGFWTLFQKGNDFQGNYDAATEYVPGQTVLFGGNTYIALQTSTGSTPSDTPADWDLFYSGVTTAGDWNTSTYYAISTIVTYGGNSYISLVAHTSTDFATDLAAGKWEKYNSGVRYMGAWTTGTNYLKDDIVSYSVSTYICTEDHTSGTDLFLDQAAGKWDTFVTGAAYVLPSTTGNAGKFLQTPDGQNYSWQFANENDKIFYVSEDSVSSADDNDHGKAIDYAFASLRFACDYIAADMANRSPATIFIKDGTYNEQLPIVVPENVTIVGDGQRNCIIQPDTTNDNGFGVGISDDGVTPNNEATMFYLSSGVMIEGLLLKGLTGFALGVSDPEDIEDATIGGVYCRLNPNSLITKSPYVKESSAFSTGGVGAIIDGSVGPSGSGGSMVFHTFTQVHDGGVGFWVKDRGLSEIVSCFTYYCDFGFAASGGGKIRGLNCNNSYGTYGSVSRGFDSDEDVTDTTGIMYGDTLTYDATTLSTPAGFSVGDTITSSTAAVGGTATGLTATANQADEMTLTTSTAHNLVDGQAFYFDNVTDNGGNTTWRGILGDATNTTKRTWWAQVIDGNNFKPSSNPALTNFIDARELAGYGLVIETITDALRSNPVRLQINGHGYVNGDPVNNISGVLGMVELNSNSYFASVVDANNIELYNDSGLTSTVDGTGFTTYISGGTAERVLVGTALTGFDVGVTGTSIEGQIENIQTNLVDPTAHRIVISNIKYGTHGDTYKVSVRSDLTDNVGNAFQIDGVIKSELYFAEGRTYIFEQNNTTNTGHPLYISAAADDGTPIAGQTFWIDGAEVTWGDYQANFAASTNRYVVLVAPTAGTYYYNCGVHTGMGNEITVTADTGQLEYWFGTDNYPLFQDGSTITAQDGVTATLAPSAHQGQQGFALVLTGLAQEPIAGGSIEFVEGPLLGAQNDADSTETYNRGTDTQTYIVTAVTGWDPVSGSATVTISQEKLDTADSYQGQSFIIRYNYSQIRLTGHDFLSIGTGGRTTTNYPGVPTQAPSQGNEVIESLPGRVYYVSTDQDGNFRIGNYFRVDQATGRATLDASAFDLSGLTSLRLGSIGAQLGESINEFSSDGTLSGNSNLAVPTEQAVKTYVDANAGTTADGQLIYGQTGDTNALLDIGTAGQVLQVNSGATAPEWITLSFDISEAFFTQTFDNSTAVYDSNGYPTYFEVGDITYSNIVWGTGGTNWSLFGGADATYYRPESWTETGPVATQNVVVNYNTTTGLIDTITVS